jgi:uncharacterized protein (TIGR02271 family)
MSRRKPGQRSSGAGRDENPGDAEEIVIPLAHEEVRAYARPLQTRVRIHKSVETRTERIEIPLQHEGVEVRRIPVDRVVTEAVQTRKEDGVLIIPVMTERLVLRKELVLLEEIHLVPVSGTETHTEDVTLRTEVVTVERGPRGAAGAGEQ